MGGGRKCLAGVEEDRKAGVALVPGGLGINKWRKKRYIVYIVAGILY